MSRRRPSYSLYNPHTAIAEKYEAMVKLAEFNSRIKDFLDIAVLPANSEFEAATLGAPITATFERRGTKIDLEPVCLLRSIRRRSLEGGSGHELRTHTFAVD